MRYLLILIVVVLSLSSCEEKTAYKKDELPTEVTKLANQNSFDTVLVIRTDDHTHFFDQKTKEYKNSVDNTKPHPLTIMLVILILVLLVCIIF